MWGGRKKQEMGEAVTVANVIDDFLPCGLEAGAFRRYPVKW